MPRKSVYFTPHNLPERIAAVAGDDARSFSQWVSLACEFMLSHPELHGQRGVIAEVQELEQALEAGSSEDSAGSTPLRAPEPVPPPAPKPPGGTKADWDRERQERLNELIEKKANRHERKP
ncbi:MAG TPA: hypothetical protein VE645_18990 [Pseudonocardiaceae bacterium]|jgi:hypothetical protein|nr:hypothetical protein [Pseudonocardiaceae bacterium]